VSHGALPHLDGVHTVFGKTDQVGMTTVLAIKQGDVINSVRVTDVA
jgi:cyclophilin family peptidyl-prolyl cis-trans isomerase